LHLLAGEQTQSTEVVHNIGEALVSKSASEECANVFGLKGIQGLVHDGVTVRKDFQIVSNVQREGLSGAKKVFTADIHDLKTRNTNEIKENK
jgi:hypothetical protein